MLCTVCRSFNATRVTPVYSRIAPVFLTPVANALQPKTSTGGFGPIDGDVTPRPKLSKEVLRTLNTAKGVLVSVDSLATPPNRNLHKKYLTVPRSLPCKLVMDVQRERWQVRTSAQKVHVVVPNMYTPEYEHLYSLYSVLKVCFTSFGKESRPFLYCTNITMSRDQ